MKNYLKNIIYTLLLTTLIYSCSDDGLIKDDIADYKSQNDGVLIPLSIGNYWDYQTIEYQYDINDMVSYKNYISDRETITDFESIDNINWYILQNDNSESLKLRNFNDGVHIYNEIKNTNILLFKSKPKINDKYKIDTETISLTYIERGELKTMRIDIDKYIKVIKTNEEFIFDDKIYYATIYRQSLSSQNEEFEKVGTLATTNIDFYIVENIGIVKEIHYTINLKNEKNIYLQKDLINYHKSDSNN